VLFLCVSVVQSNDTQRIYEAFPFMNTVWTSPVTIIVCVVLLWLQIDVSTLASVFLMFLLIPVQVSCCCPALCLSLFDLRSTPTLRLTTARITSSDYDR
jgi:hypothetical protein